MEKESFESGGATECLQGHNGSLLFKTCKAWMPYVIPDAVQEAPRPLPESDKERGLVLGLHQRQERLLDSCTSSPLAQRSQWK